MKNLVLKKILFVCTGNTCRSPMAEAFFNSAAQSDKEIAEKFISFSGGLAAQEGSPASMNSIHALQDCWKIDLTSHKARPVRIDDLNSAHLILTMELLHKEAIISSFPDIQSKVYTLKEFIGEPQTGRMKKDGSNFNIVDPYGGSIQTYKFCAQEIKNAVYKLVEKLKNNFK